ncbi:DUF3592 domain-containing protein [Flavobacterium sp. LHD-80]|uniref:DUF3592 domain-containing protein n=1 Tax=Flavobacterium sp. LHD-80 TaxID=3071411 RepID=UPI0027DEDC3D|nr:DUF3592 domain-containing protein [Flavobacterium sp. LHD-80]MDQ6471855.1 DUF3592 domain-containing protein [Flavobacterium sp. LHD-80]
MKSSISIMKYIFCIIGLVLLAVAFSKYQEKMAFIKKAAVGQGKIEDIVSDDTSIVSFTTKKGKQIQFTSYNSINPLSNDEDKIVEVLYDPVNPTKAKVNNFGSLYLASSVLALAGTVFFLTGFSFFRSDYFKRKKIYYLHQNGKRIATKFNGLQLNMHVTVNGSHPYFICSKWLDLTTNKTYLFESDDIWLDPTEFSITHEIIVLIDPKDPNRYHMDISFLKK